MWQLRNPRHPSELLSLQRYQLDFALSPAYATLMAGGWGSGKTTAGLGFCAFSSWMTPTRSVGIVVLPNFPMLEEWLHEQFFPAFGRIVRQHFVKKRLLILPSGKKIYYKSAHDPERIQATNADWIYADEPQLMKRRTWEHIVARARVKDSRLRIGLTSLPKIGWLSEQFGVQKTDDDYRCMHIKTSLNQYNDQSYVEKLKRACPRRMWPAYLEGQFVPMGGVVYPEFNTVRHVIHWPHKDHVQMADGSHSRAVYNIVADPSPRRPHVLWVQRVPAGTVMPLRGGSHWVTKKETSIVVDEIYPDCEYHSVTTKRLADWIIRRQRPDGIPWKFSEAVVDPATIQRQMTSDLSNDSIYIQLKKFLGLPVVYSPGERIKVGIQHVQLALEPSVGDPTLFFSDRLLDADDTEMTPHHQSERSVLSAMLGYSYKEGANGILVDEPYHDDVYSHAADCVRYHERYYYPQDEIKIREWSAM